ncbi:MAG TPA: hypothetical protein ENF73_00210, partial [Proteobacteria bacterium]|nr:hypothetical protein [Pseudomonadota bacterium]
MGARGRFGGALLYGALIASLALNLFFVGMGLIDLRAEKAAEGAAGKPAQKAPKRMGVPIWTTGWERIREEHKKKLDALEKKELAKEKVLAIGYASGTMKAPKWKNVTVYDPKLAY